MLVSLPFHSVSGNSLEEEGAKHLASALAVNQTLTSVEYAANCSISYCHHPMTPVCTLLYSQCTPQQPG